MIERFSALKPITCKTSRSGRAGRWLGSLLVMLMLLMLIAVPGIAQRGRRPASVTAPLSEREKRFVRDLMKKMRLDEKVSQMVMIWTNAPFMNVQSEPFQKLRQAVLDNKIGGIIVGITNVYEAAIHIARLQELARIPLLVAADLEAGPAMRILEATSFPFNMGLGATGDPSLAYEQGKITAREARALGINMIFAPVADVNNNPANPIINIRSYGEDPEMVAQFVEAFIRGAQENGVLATAKHFPGHGDTSVDSHRSLPVINVPRQRLEEVELVPFRRAIAAGVAAIMSAHIALPQIDPTPAPPLIPEAPPDKILPTVSPIEYERAGTLPATLSEPILTGLLRRDLGFNGLIVTDAMDMGGIVAHFEAGDAAVRAVRAGADMILMPPNPERAIAAIVEAVQKKEIPESRIDASVERILAAKVRLGLFTERFVDLDDIDTIVAAPDAVRTAEDAAARSLTLLRDSRQLIPLADAKNKRILHLAVVAEENRSAAGRTLTAELEKRAPRTEMFVVDARTGNEEIQMLLDRVARFDVIIMSLFVRPQSYRGSIALPPPGDRLLRALLANNLPLIVVSFGNPYFLLTYPDIGTYLLAWGDYRLSVPSQRAVARALLGEAPITGKLPVTFPGLYPRGFGIEVGVKETK
ncbi:MAG TPA: glycoside hydrolase family 3 N-terminal domain-containing protein [Blastocatellia bacterium]|nr:glycoside hydrolase family 3 N-terminal domain-containing protein [Blastocatellia bacterium]